MWLVCAAAGDPAPSCVDGGNRMKGVRSVTRVCLAVILVFSMILGGLPARTLGDGPGAGPFILVVGEQDKMKTRNPLPALADDIWTRDVLDRVYDSLGKFMPDIGNLVPYIVKGVDYDENGVFDVGEYGTFAKAPTTDLLNITAYYDLNGVYFHDGVQVTPGDIFFSYQLQAMNPRTTVDMRVLMDMAGGAGSNYSISRWLFMSLVTKNWQNEPALGNPSLRFAIRFLLQEPSFMFYRTTLTETILYPRHVWEGTGWRNDTTSPGCTRATPCTVTNLHADFGKTIYPENDSLGRFGQGIPTTDLASNPFIYLNSATPQPDSAVEWDLTDRDVIGTGPFYFDSLDGVTGIAVVRTDPYYFTGIDRETGQTVDPYVCTYLHLPSIDGISFRVYSTATLGVLALINGDIDFWHAPLAPDFLPTLSNYSTIRIFDSADPGFTYVGYNMRRLGLGTLFYGQPNQFDVGYHFRKAIAHLINKTSIVSDRLLNYGVPGVVPLSPSNVRFLNSSLAGYDFDESAALVEIREAHNDSLTLVSMIPDAVNWYTWNATGVLYLPGKGTNTFDLLCPNADYDVVSAGSCLMIAAEMQKIGIHVRPVPTAHAAILTSLIAHDFDMVVDYRRIEDPDPEYFYDLFHSLNAAAGVNYVGFNNGTMDSVLDAARRELNENTRVGLFGWAQAVLLDNLPYDTLYFRENFEAERQDRYGGWMRLFGTIWNYWSLIGLVPRDSIPPAVTITSPTTGQILTVSPTIVTGTASDTGGSGLMRVDVRVNGGNWIVAAGTSAWTATVSLVPGSNTIEAKAWDNASNPSTVDSVTVIYTAYPKAAFTVTPSSGNVTTAFALDASSCSDPQDPPGLLEVRWDWEDNGTWDTSWSTTKTAQHRYASVGNYTIRLEVRDTGGLTDNTTRKVWVNNTPPVAVILLAPSIPNPPPFSVWADASASSDLEDTIDNLSVRWDWQDDGIWETSWTTGKMGHYQYPSPGIYAIRLEVRDTGGLVANATKLVSILLDPPTNLVAEPGGSEGTIHVTWSHVTSEYVHHYVVAVYDSDSAAQPLKTVNSTTADLTVGDLVAGKRYWFRIWAVDNLSRPSQPSAMFSAVAAEAAPPSSSTWLIVGGIVGVAAAVAAIAFLLLWRRRKASGGKGPEE